MTNEELKAKIESIKNLDDAYKMACEGGYKGTVEEFKALVENAADEIMPMNLDDMENVAGGFGFDDVKNGFNNAVDYVSDACGKAATWVKENPALTAEIAGGVALVGIAIGTSVVAYKAQKTKAMGLNQQKFNEGIIEDRKDPNDWAYYFDYDKVKI